jgi:hypothetical protein
MTARGLSTGVATWLIGSFGVSNSSALGLGATILYMLTTTLHTSFCKMTELEILKSYGVNLPVDPKRKTRTRAKR